MDDDASIQVVFYGLFMDVERLRAKGLRPRSIHTIMIEDHRVQLGAKAWLLPALGRRAPGVLATLTRSEMRALYADLPDYREVQVRAYTNSGELVRAISMVHQQPPLAAPPDPEYVCEWRVVARSLGFAQGEETSL